MTVIVVPGMRVLAVVLWIVSVALVPLAVLGDGSAWLAPVPSVFIAFLAWAVLWRPRIELTADALRIVDVRRTSTYAWRRVTEVRTKYGLEVVTSEGVRRTWIATRPTARLGTLGSGPQQPGGTVRLTVDAAADAVRAHIPAAAAQDGPPPATVTAAPIVHRPHGWTVVALVVLGFAATMAAAQL
ncbi:PH domain-containing protein [Curtobacterium sp. 'Ferrero']|uniref:PH domain-containing protein n=1 Tax=Curtobacterium sp. 'Ferrero' TaxID=2033654 RepID=UPI00114403EF|nr:PH domain-containing protein [Curtobacterium sp. 'Ferrero']